MVISLKQEATFDEQQKQLAAADLAAHVAAFFPAQAALMGPDALRSLVQYAYTRGRRYGMATLRNVCLYLDNMLAWGSNFDTDPQYPWAAAALAAGNPAQPSRTMDALCSASLNALTELGDCDQAFQYRTLVASAPDYAEFCLQVSTAPDAPDSTAGTLQYIAQLFPQKQAMMGAAGLEQFATGAVQTARRHDMAGGYGIAVWMILQAVLGHGLDADPQFYPWMSTLPRGTEATGDDRAAQLYNASVRYMEAIILYNDTYPAI